MKSKRDMRSRSLALDSVIFGSSRKNYLSSSLPFPELQEDFFLKFLGKMRFKAV